MAKSIFDHCTGFRSQRAPCRGPGVVEADCEVGSTLLFPVVVGWVLQRSHIFVPFGKRMKKVESCCQV